MGFIGACGVVHLFLQHFFLEQESHMWTTHWSCFAALQALLRVESLVRGGAAGLEGFLEMLKPLRQPLTVQLNDRSPIQLLCMMYM
jgi:hypothetical protein